MAKTNKSAMIPQTSRKQNEVGRLHAEQYRLAQRAQAIQAKCKHDFRLTKPPRMFKTPIPDVFIVCWNLVVVCTKCNKRERITKISRICPRCLSKTRCEEVLRKRYGHLEPGNSPTLSTTKLYTCTNCGFEHVGIAPRWGRSIRLECDEVTTLLTAVDND